MTINVETNERLSQTFTAEPLILRRERYSDGHNAPADRTSVMLKGVAVPRTGGWPKATAGDLRRMADACSAAATAMENA